VTAEVARQRKSLRDSSRPAADAHFAGFPLPLAVPGPVGVAPTRAAAAPPPRSPRPPAPPRRDRRTPAPPADRRTRRPPTRRRRTRLRPGRGNRPTRAGARVPFATSRSSAGESREQRGARRRGRPRPGPPGKPSPPAAAAPAHSAAAGSVGRGAAARRSRSACPRATTPRTAARTWPRRGKRSGPTCRPRRDPSSPQSEAFPQATSDAQATQRIGERLGEGGRRAAALAAERPERVRGRAPPVHVRVAERLHPLGDGAAVVSRGLGGRQSARTEPGAAAAQVAQVRTSQPRCARGSPPPL
jgi:hypothetical protein